ncbi:MAG: hypothetical protein J6I40_01475 [Mailhella sp.]|nr:hypothetical protein [Mailhella sp.]
MRRRLSLAEAVDAARMLFELNTGEQGVLSLARQAGLPADTKENREHLLLEWRAYVHAAVLYALMVQAPNVVVLEYLRVTQIMLRSLGYSSNEGKDFVDGAFSAYAEPMVRTQTQECPAVFFRRLLGKDIREVPGHAAAMVSGVMAMILSAVMDKLEQYDFALE